MPKPSELFKTRFLEAMEKKGFSQIEMAKASGLAQPLISQYLNGKRAPSLDSLVDIARALEVSTDSLLGHASPGSPGPRRPTPLEIAEYLFEHGAPNIDPRAMQLFKKAISADESQLSVLEKYVDDMFGEELVDDSNSGSSS